MTGLVVAAFVLSTLLAVPQPAPAQELPAELAARFSAGVAALKAGRLDAAEAAFRAVLAAGGTQAFVHHNLGLVLRERGRTEEALAAFHAATLRDPDFAPARLLAGTVLLAIGRPAEAARELRQAVRLAPDEIVARLQLADALERTGDAAGVVHQYRAIVARVPGDAEYAYRLGRAYLRLSQAIHERLRTSRPPTARAGQALGREFEQQGQIDRAIHAYAEAARLDPSLPDLPLALARLFADQGRWDEATAQVTRALALDPDSREAGDLEARIRAARPPRP